MVDLVGPHGGTTYVLVLSCGHWVGRRKLPSKTEVPCVGCLIDAALRQKDATVIHQAAPPRADGHHGWTQRGKRAQRPREGATQTCCRCGLKRRATLYDVPSRVLRALGKQAWVWQYQVGEDWTMKRPPCKGAA